MDIVKRLREQADSWLSFDWDNDDIFDDAANEIERLQKQIRYQEHRDGRMGTHDPVCYAYGPRHYECALREIERLREALQTIAEEDSGWGQYVAFTTLKERE